MNLLNFYSKINVTPGGCMLWQGFVDKDGYGRRWGRIQLAHRFSYQINKGDLDPALTIDHLCRVRNCVNPAHLEQVAIKENLARSITFNSTKTHCRRGHKYDALNTYSYKTSRVCRPCNNLATARYKKRKAIAGNQ